MSLSKLRSFTIAAGLAFCATAGSTAFADTPKAADKKADKPADKPADKATGKKDMLSDADAQKFYEFFDKFVTIAVTNKDDCAKMAAGINAHIDGNGPLLKMIAEAKSQNKDLPADVKSKIMKKTTEELAPAMTKCGQDKDVNAAMMRMRGPK